MKQEYFEQKRRKRRLILLPVAFLLQLLSLSAMAFLLVEIEEFLFTRYGIYLTLHYRPLYELSTQDNLSLGIIISSALIAVSLVSFLILAFIKHKYAITRIALLIIVNISSVLYVQSWRGIYNHIDPSRYRGSRTPVSAILTYDVLRDNIDFIVWFFVVIISGCFIASVFAFMNPRGWTLNESTDADSSGSLSDPSASGESYSSRPSSIKPRGNPDVPVCPWFSESMSMCSITDDHIPPEGNRIVRYCTSGNCINCPDYR